MVSTVARDYADLAEGRVEDRMSEVTLHVVSGLVEVAVSGDVILPLLAENATVRVDDDRRVPDDVAIAGLALEDRRDDDDAVLLSDLHHESRRRPG